MDNKHDSAQHKIKNKNNFTTEVKQAVHDIRSPLACLFMLSKEEVNYPLPEKKLITDKLIDKINGILFNLVNMLEDKETEITDVKPEEKQIIIISQAIQEIITEKKLEYNGLGIEFKYNNCKNSAHLSLWGNALEFQRMLSNLINNAIEACNGAYKEVKISLNKDDQYIIATIEDNGMGMPHKLKNKILSGVTVTAGKPHGQGLGFTQVRQTLDKLGGSLNIESQINKGTKISLIFPKHKH